MTVAFPDWPSPGPIDLVKHDPPHASSTTEWWYLHAHVERDDGRPLSLFAAFFRILKPGKPGDAPSYGHTVTWALTDLEDGTYYPESRVDPSAPKLGAERIKSGRGSKDPRVNRAMLEALERGVVPLPDRVIEGEIRVATGALSLDYGGLRFEKLEEGSYRLRLDNPRDGAGCDLVFHLEKSPVLQGDDGVVKGPGGEDMFYYFVPRCDVAGSVTLRGETRAAKGSGWYDHEFGAVRLPPGGAPALPKDAPPPKGHDIAWNWIGIQLSDGSEASVYSLVHAEDESSAGQWVVVVEPSGASRTFHEMTLTPMRTWRSKRTFQEYPTRWTLEVPGAGLRLELEAAADDQEFMTVISKPAFWEGRVNVHGTRAEGAVTGRAYLERSGFEAIEDLDDFFSAVGEEVRKSVAALLPLDPTWEEVRGLIGGDERAHYMDGVDVKQLARSLIAPVREITDRGGKSWRSYAALACCDVVQGDSRRYVQWLSIPELMHVGSLIVDDVQDKSTVRRGKPTAHVLYGEPIAINAGTYAYFLAQKGLIAIDVTPPQRMRIYDLYFEAMRAGHAGQALDLDGPSELMPAAVASGDSSALEARILATHRLKTAAPAGALARMGAITGGGNEAQIEAVGAFFEALGLAFQLMDDVLNLRGFKGDLKAKAEDISNGTITLPIAKAMSRLSESDRASVWRTLSSKPKDAAVVAEVVQKLEACGAIQAVSEQARELVEVAWQRASPLLKDSFSKIMFRAFSWYVLERHY
jgi:geranylgeranyl pyrophosphate synthase/predicted secreted hydrolase